MFLLSTLLIFYFVFMYREFDLSRNAEFLVKLLITLVFALPVYKLASNMVKAFRDNVDNAINLDANLLRLYYYLDNDNDEYYYAQIDVQGKKERVELSLEDFLDLANKTSAEIEKGHERFTYDFENKILVKVSYFSESGIYSQISVK